jgi:hypothetical protein
MDVSIEADSPGEAREKAYDMAGDLDFSGREHDAEYVATVLTARN